MGKGAKTQTNKPGYYLGDAVIKFIELFKLNFARGSIIKYVARAGHKDDELVDLQKAKYYLDREIERIRKKRSKHD